MNICDILNQITYTYNTFFIWLGSKLFNHTQNEFD